MPKFSYQAYTKSREKKEGIIEAENKSQALSKLDSMALFPINIDPLEEAKEGKPFGRRIGGRITLTDVSVFTRQVSNLLDAGLTILSALLHVSRQTWKPAFHWIIERLIEDLREGRTYSDALAQHPAVFSSLYVSLIKSAEIGGFLEEAMARLADYLENEEELRAKVRSAMIYPLLIAIVGTITVYILLSFVIPKLVLVFEDFGQILPLPTLILITISSFLSHYWWLVALAGVVLFFIVNRIKATAEGKTLFDALGLNMPVLGKVFLKRQMAQFARVLATLLGNGVTILPSLQIVRDIIGNSLLQKEIEKIRVEVRDGSTLSKAMAKAKYFPTSIVNIISVGEESGGLEKVLKKVSDSYERDVDRSLKAFTALLEPLMILVMGSIVAFIVIAMLLPIFQINFMAR